MAQLTEEDQVKLREAFQNYEIAGTSSIKSEDLAALLRASGQAPTESDLEAYAKVNFEFTICS